MALQDHLDTPLARAVRIAGSQVRFAEIVGRRQSVVQDWLRFGRLLPAELVAKVEEATGISRHELRPDLSELFGHNAESAGQVEPLSKATGAVPAAPSPGCLLPGDGPVSGEGVAA